MTNNKFKAGDKVVISKECCKISWYDQIIRTVIGSPGRGMVELFPNLKNTTDTGIDNQIAECYVDLLSERHDILFEIFYDEQY